MFFIAIITISSLSSCTASYQDDIGSVGYDRCLTLIVKSQQVVICYFVVFIGTGALMYSAT